MIKINLVNAKYVFDKEVSMQKEAVMDICDEQEAKKRIEQMDKKVIHTEEVISDGLKVTKELQFNESVKDFSYVAFLNHDIGRFAQMRYMGNYTDSELDKTIGIKNHGVLGKNILTNIIDEQLPHMSVYHEPIMKIVNDHVDKKNSIEELMVLRTNLLRDYSMEELLYYPSVRQNVVNSITQIVQDVDRLDIYHQILEDRWTPMKVEEDIDPKVFEMFYKGEYLNMALLKEQGLWNANVGELVRLSFINQIKLLSVAKVIQDENIIMKLKDKRQNPKTLDAFEYTNQKLDEMINNSTDGVTVGKVMVR